MSNTQIRVMEEALTESGIIPFHRDDEPLTTELSEIIGILFRALQANGMTESQIKELV